MDKQLPVNKVKVEIKLKDLSETIVVYAFLPPNLRLLDYLNDLHQRNTLFLPIQQVLEEPITLINLLNVSMIAEV